jgi:hypothetical protein
MDPLGPKKVTGRRRTVGNAVKVDTMKQKGKYNGSVKLERPGPLDRDRRYVAPTRVEKKFEDVKKLVAIETIWGRSVVREWKKGDLHRLYWPDSSYLYVDATGAVRTSGGEASRAKFKHGLI